MGEAAPVASSRPLETSEAADSSLAGEGKREVSVDKILILFFPFFPAIS